MNSPAKLRAAVKKAVAPSRDEQPSLRSIVDKAVAKLWPCPTCGCKNATTVVTCSSCARPRPGYKSHAQRQMDMMECGTAGSARGPRRTISTALDVADDGAADDDTAADDGAGTSNAASAHEPAPSALEEEPREEYMGDVGCFRQMHGFSGELREQSRSRDRYVSAREALRHERMEFDRNVRADAATVHAFDAMAKKSVALGRIAGAACSPLQLRLGAHTAEVARAAVHAWGAESPAARQLGEKAAREEAAEAEGAKAQDRARASSSAGAAPKVAAGALEQTISAAQAVESASAAALDPSKGALALGGCGLTELPRLLRTTLAMQLGSLRSILLPGNKLRSLPPSTMRLMGVVTELDLGRNRLRSLPDELGQLTRLTSLKLGHNHIEILPSAMCHIGMRLKRLHLESNSLTRLPPTFGHLHRLQELRLQQNQVTVLPGSFWHLNSLRHLDLSTNGLLTLALIPPLREHGPVVVPSSSVDEWQEIADPSAGPGSTVWVNPRTGEAQRWRPWTDDTAPKQKAVQAATQAGEGQAWEMQADPSGARRMNYRNLRTGELLDHMPEELDFFGQLSELRLLRLQENMISELPSSFTCLSQLTRLNLSDNPLRLGLPASLAITMTELRVLKARDTQLRDLPPSIGLALSLVQLDISSNYLVTLPPSLGLLTNLTNLDASWNSLRDLPSGFGFMGKHLRVLNFQGNDLDALLGEMPKAAADRDGGGSGVGLRYASRSLTLDNLLWCCRQKRLREIRGDAPPQNIPIIATGLGGERRVTGPAAKVQLQDALKAAECCAEARIICEGCVQLRGRARSYYCEACFWKLHENRLAESDGAGIEEEEKQQAKVEQASHSSRRREMYRGGTGGNRGRAPGSSARAGRREASEEPRDSAEDSHERAQIWAPLSKEGDRRWQAGEDPPPKRQFTQRTFHKETSALHEWRLASVEGCTAGGGKAGGAAERAAATGRAKVHYCQEGSQQFELHWLALPDLPDGLLTRRHVHTLRLTGHAFRGMGAKAFCFKDLRQLRHVELRTCQIEELAPSLGSSLHNVRYLSLECNHLTVLPDSLCTLPHIVHLRLRENRLTTLPAALGHLKRLEVLLLDSNELRSLPDTLCDARSLRVLSVNRNTLLSLCKGDWARLTQLERVCLNGNMLAEHAFPPSFANMPLLRELQLGFNQIVDPPAAWGEGCFRTSLQQLVLSNNRVIEFPLSWHALLALTEFNFSGNPLISPPAALDGKPTPKVLKYLRLRFERMKELKACLRSAGFVIDDDAFHPVAKECVTAGSGFLSVDDLHELDIAADRFLNGPFYLYLRDTGVGIASALSSLRAQRRQNTYQMIVAELLSTLRDETSSRRGPGGRRRFGSGVLINNVMQELGEDGEHVKCFAVTMQALLKDVHAPWKRGDKPGEAKVTRQAMARTILQRLAENEGFNVESAANVDWGCTEVLEAIKGYRAPFGYGGPEGGIAIVNQLVDFPSCEHPDELLPGFDTTEDARDHRECIKTHPALIVVRTIYTEEEAARRREENQLMYARLSSLQQLMKHWFGRPKGDGGGGGFDVLHKEVARRKMALPGRLRHWRHAAQGGIPALAKAVDAAHDIAQRAAKFDRRLARPFHNFKSSLDVDSEQDRVRAKMSKHQKAIEESSAKLADAESQARYTRDEHVARTLADLKPMLLLLTEQEVERLGRMKAWKEQLRRPWDGEEGTTYTEWCKVRELNVEVHLEQTISSDYHRAMAQARGLEVMLPEDLHPLDEKSKWVWDGIEWL